MSSFTRRRALGPKPTRLLLFRWYRDAPVLCLPLDTAARHTQASAVHSGRTQSSFHSAQRECQRALFHVMTEADTQLSRQSGRAICRVPTTIDTSYASIR